MYACGELLLSRRGQRRLVGGHLIWCLRRHQIRVPQGWAKLRRRVPSVYQNGCLHQDQALRVPAAVLTQPPILGV